ncbi:MAG: hypothetical protein KBT40_07455 [bacterium]|nr:hypothetical protein [Candidatus Minthenecus merdequi]
MDRLLGILLIFSTLFFVGCDSKLYNENEAEQPIFSVTGIDYGEGYKSYSLNVKVQGEMPVLAELCADSLMVVEVDHHGNVLEKSKTASVVDVQNVEARIIDSIGVKLLVVVDLTLPQNLVDSQYANVRKIRRLYSTDNLYLSFIHADSVSESYLASDYIIDNYFVSESDTLVGKYLYRAVYEKYCELTDTSTVLGANWFSALIVFSDGNVYGYDATPIDPNHYQLQSDILREIEQSRRPIYYVGLDNSANGAQNDAAIFLQLVAERSSGYYSESLDWQSCETYIREDIGISYDNYRLELNPPSGRMFDGSSRLRIFLSHNDSLYFLVDTRLSIGSVSNPVVVDGTPKGQLVFEGILFTILLIVFIYVVCQFLIPYVLYQVFRKRHTMVYVGPNTTLNGVPIGDQCYFCKTRFAVGDRVVAKCQHTMHEQCWNENDYHCPEHGRKCSHGAHYYNQTDLFDPMNATFYTNWLIYGVIIALITWVTHMSYDSDFNYNWIVKFISGIYSVDSGSADYVLLVDKIDSSLDPFPSYGAFVGFVFTFFLGLSICLGRFHIRRFADLLMRALISWLCGFVFFLTGFVVKFVCSFDFDAMVNVVPWTATALSSVELAVHNTRVHPNRKLFFGMALVSVLLMYVWNVSAYYVDWVEYWFLSFVSNLLFSVGLMLSVATPRSESENYVLHITGCVKEMDIAISKWFRRSAGQRVTIGRSVDCCIQTSWDVQGNVAAVHAEVVSYRRQICLVPLEEGVREGKRMLKVNHRYKLYHGRSFTIGTTTFTFRELDL